MKRTHRTAPDLKAEPIRAATYARLLVALDLVYPGKWRRAVDVCPVAVNKTIDCEADALKTIRRITVTIPDATLSGLAALRALVEAVQTFEKHQNFGWLYYAASVYQVLPAAREALEWVEADSVARHADDTGHLHQAEVRIARLEETLRDLLGWAVELDDPRLSYLVVQMDRTDVAAAQAELEPIVSLPRRGPIIQGDAAVTTLEIRDECV